jgi:hypothetical protein
MGEIDNRAFEEEKILGASLGTDHFSPGNH